MPSPGAFPLIATVQREVAGPVTVAGVQLRELTVSGTASVMFPPELVVRIAWPDGSEVDTPDKKIGIVPPAVGAIWRVKFARVPCGTTLSFMPNTKQVSDPVPPLQSSVLDAAFADEPILALTEVMLDGKLMANLTAASCASLLAENKTARLAVSPGLPDVEPRPTDTDCAARVETYEASTNGMKAHNFIQKIIG